MLFLIAALVSVALVAAAPVSEPDLAPFQPTLAEMRNLFLDIDPTDSSSSAAPPTVNETVAGALRLHVQYAMAVFSPSVHDLRTWNCSGCCANATDGTKIVESFGANDAYGAYGVIAINPLQKSILAIFRGSSTMRDWITDAWLTMTDLNLPAVELNLSNYTQQTMKTTADAINFTSKIEFPPGIMIHSGFDMSYNISRAIIQSTLKNLATEFTDYTIIFTGHSLGGAMASLAAVDYVCLNGIQEASRVKLFTYGQPRIGNLVWANWVNSIPFAQIARVTRQKDPVPHLPPPKSGYTHFSQEYGIDVNQNLVACDNTGVGGETTGCQTENFWVPKFKLHPTGYFDRPPCYV